MFTFPFTFCIQVPNHAVFFRMWFAIYLEMLRAANGDSPSLPPIAKPASVFPSLTWWARSVGEFWTKLILKTEFGIESPLNTSFSQWRVWELTNDGTWENGLKLHEGRFRLDTRKKHIHWKCYQTLEMVALRNSGVAIPGSIPEATWCGIRC